MAARKPKIVPVQPDLVLGVSETLDAIPVKPEDAGARALALRYAHTIETAKATAEALEGVEIDPEDEGGRRQLAALAAKVEAYQVMVDLGPKLLAALDALGATPKARSVSNGGIPNVGGNPAVGALARLQARRAVSP